MATKNENGVKVLVRNIVNHKVYASETVECGGYKFQIYSFRNRNRLAELSIYVLTKNGEKSFIANEDDIPEFANEQRKLYTEALEFRMKEILHNLKAAEDYILKVYG